MDLHFIENIIKITEEKSITKAAEKLFVTQSALNQQLLKLESELGTPIFIRNRSDWKLTEAGEEYVRTSKLIIQMKKDAYNKISDIAEIKNNRITIGLIPERGVNMFTAVYPKFHFNNPTAILEPVEYNVIAMQREISNGNIDLGLITISENQKDKNKYIHMANEEILLGVPAKHSLAYLGNTNATEAPIIKLENFQNDSFMLMFQQSTMYEIEKYLFEKANFKPDVLFSTSSNLSKHRMVCAGVGCAFIPMSFAIYNENIVFFRLEEKPFWEITICCHNRRYLSKIEREFVEACKKYWGKKLSNLLEI